jgi:class 3 adenylate cyclase
MERKQCAIFAADVVGFSRLMGRDEEATVSAVRESFAVVQQLVEERHGQVFGGAGDSILAEFASPIQAVRCAIEVQESLGRRNAEVPDDQRLSLRVAVNFGPVLVTDDDLLGNSVNLAVRIEGLADPGGIVISDDTYRHLKDQVRATFEDMGEHRVRGYSEPVRVYRVEPPCQTGANERRSTARAKVETDRVLKPPAVPREDDVASVRPSTITSPLLSCCRLRI